MSKTKYPILDENFKLRMLAACKDEEEKGLILLLDLTGMHISSLCKLTPKNLLRQGNVTHIEWIRPKTNKTLPARIPDEDLETIQFFLKKRRKSRQYYHQIVRRIGIKAGFDGVSPMTFRHNRCLRALNEEGYSIFEVPQIMGCTLDVAVRNYTKLREDQLFRDKGVVKSPKAVSVQRTKKRLWPFSRRS